MAGWFNGQLAEQSEKMTQNLSVSEQIRDAINKLNTSTTKLNKIMVWLTGVLVLLTVVLVVLTFKLAFPKNFAG